MPVNGRGGPLKADFTDSVTENIPPDLQDLACEFGKGEKVR